MNKYRVQAAQCDEGEVIEADFIEVRNMGAICFYTEKSNDEGELIAVRPLKYLVTKEA